MIFNVGFFSVVPFLAVVMRDDFGMGTMAVGTIQDDSTHSAAARKNHGSTLFALLVVCGEVGTVVGPLLGALLLNTSFDTALLVSAGVFAVMAAVFLCFLPTPRRDGAEGSGELPAASPPSDLWSCLREKKFIGFAGFYSVNLLATNQLILGFR